jgi:hypothetical protein
MEGVRGVATAGKCQRCHDFNREGRNKGVGPFAFRFFEGDGAADLI